MKGPKLRFKTDNGDKFPNLEVKKLGDITTPYNVRNKNTLPLEVYSVNNIVGFVPQSEQFDDAGYLRDTDTSIYMIVPPKHFAYNPARIDVGSIGYQYLDHDVQVSSLYEVFKTSDSVNDDFLWIWFHTSCFNHTVKRLQEGGVRLYFYYDKMQETKIGLPSLTEQQKIASLFTELDKLIQSAEKELDGYRELKQGMLQKMFPKKGEKVPEIRFPEFTGDWKQHKLGEVFEQTSNLVNPKEDEIELWSLTVEDGLTKKSDRYNREFLVKKDDNFKEVRPGDIVYNPMNMTLGAVGYNGMAKSVAVSGYYTTMVTKENYDTYYINTWLKSPQAIHLYRTYATGSLTEKQRVQFPTLSIIPVAFPKYEEQTKIGSYFHSLDNLITLHQQELDGYKKLKKGLLQQMFC